MIFQCKNRAGALAALQTLEAQTSGAVHNGIHAVRVWVEANTENDRMPEETRRHMEEWYKKYKEEEAAEEQRLKEYWDSLTKEEQRLLAPIIETAKMTCWGMNAFPHNQYQKVDPDYVEPPLEGMDTEDEY
jgi:hypothetical protein